MDEKKFKHDIIETDNISDIIITNEGDVEPHEINIRLFNKEGDSIIIENGKEMKEGEDWKISKSDIIRMSKLSHDLSILRGMVLSKAIEMENTLDSIIVRLFFGNEITKEHKIFTRHILKSTKFDLFDKWSLFRILVKEYDIVNKDSDIVKRIQSLMESRNKLAHGSIVFVDGRPHLSYYRNNDVQYERVDKIYLDQLFESFERTNVELTSISHKLKKNNNFNNNLNKS